MNLIAMRLDDDSDMNAMRGAVDRYRDRFEPAVVVLGARDGSGKARIVAGVSKALGGAGAGPRTWARIVAERLGRQGRRAGRLRAGRGAAGRSAGMRRLPPFPAGSGSASERGGRKRATVVARHYNGRVPGWSGTR